MDESSVVHLFDRRQHLDQQLDGNLQAVIRLEHFPHLGQVAAQEIHDDQISLAVFDKIMNIADMLESPELSQDTIFKHENGLILAFALDLQSYFFAQLFVEGLVDVRVGSLA